MSDDSGGEQQSYAIAIHAGELTDRGRHDQARRMLVDALRGAPSDEHLLYELARADDASDQSQRARETLGQLLTVNPRHVSGRYLLAAIECDAGSLSRAEEILLELLREQPREESFYALYARVMLRALQFEKASRLADEALRLSPTSASALGVRVMCDFVNHRPGTDNEALVRLIKEDPNDRFTLNLVLMALIDQRRNREAHELAREMLRANPRDVHMLSLVKDLRVTTHWSMLPLWPMQRWGWYGVAGVWLLGVGLSSMLGRVAPAMAGPFTLLWLLYVAYSWVWPTVLGRLLARGDKR